MTETETEEKTCWHVEYCSFDAGRMAWMPFIQIFDTEQTCEQQIAAWKNVKHITAARVTGPHTHLAPKVTP